MRSMTAIFKRELKAYFTQPVAYVMMGGLLFIVGLLYDLNLRRFLGISVKAMHNPVFAAQLDLSSMVLASTISSIGIVSVLTLPLITMRLWSAEKRAGTAELLLTFPLRERDIVLGKFFAALAVYTLLLVLTLLYPLLTSLFGTLDPGLIVSGYIGTLLMGAALLSLGFLCSTWTESQLVACALAWVGFLLFWLMGHVADFVGGKLAIPLTHVSFANHYDNFIKGIVETQNIAFFVLFSLFALFLTLRSIAALRWRG